MTRTVYGKRFAALHRARSATGVASDAPHGVHVVDVDVAGVALAGAPCGSLAATYATPSPHASWWLASTCPQCKHAWAIRPLPWRCAIRIWRQGTSAQRSLS